MFDEKRARAFSRFQRCYVLIVIIVLSVLILLIALAGARVIVGSVAVNDNLVVVNKGPPTSLPDFSETTS